MLQARSTIFTGSPMSSTKIWPRPPIDEGWLHEQLEQLAQLADEGDTLEVVAKLGAIVREPKREAIVVPEPSVSAVPQSAPGAQLS